MNETLKEKIDEKRGIKERRGMPHTMRNKLPWKKPSTTV